MIPDLPPSVSDTERLDFYSTLVGNLSDQSTIHVNWHTHRQNPSTCWICDLLILMSKILHITQSLIGTKSSLDMETESSSEDASDSEIENDLNHNEETTPEYDVVDPEESEE